MNWNRFKKPLKQFYNNATIPGALTNVHKKGSKAIDNLTRSSSYSSTGTPYDQTINRLEYEQSQNPYLTMANNAQAQMRVPYQRMEQNIANRANQGYMTESAYADNVVQGYGQFADQNSAIFKEAEALNIQKNLEHQSKINELKMSRDMYLEDKRRQKEAEDKARQQGWTSALLQGAGFVAGNTIMPGIGGMIGSSIGKGVAGLANNNPMEFADGLVGTMTGINSMSPLKSQKAFNDRMIKIGVDFINLPHEYQSAIIGFVEAGDYENANLFMTKGQEYLNNLNVSPTVQTSALVSPEVIQNSSERLLNKDMSSLEWHKGIPSTRRRNQAPKRPSYWDIISPYGGK